MLNYLRDENGVLLTSDSFSLSDYTSRIDPRMLTHPEGRIELTRYDPLLFMLVYLPHWMRSEETGNVLSINDTNILVCSQALEWLRPRNQPKRHGLRQVDMAPRSSTKSSTSEGCVLWAGVNAHIPYMLMFSGDDTSSTKHLDTIVEETETNALLRMDFPEFCTSKRKAKNVYKSSNGVTIESRSWSSTVLGAKAGKNRPGLLLFDDISRVDGSGSPYQAAEMLESLLGKLLPLNDAAPVLYLCTNHFIGSVEDDFMKSLSSDEEAEKAQWVEDERFTVNWLKPIIERPDGSLRSIWPERWSLEYLQSIQHTRTYSKDFLNLPVPLGSGEWFKPEMFTPATQLPVTSLYVLSEDASISEHGDPAGFAVLGFSQSAHQAVLYEAFSYQEKATKKKERVFNLLEQYPQIKHFVYEATQGGEALFYATYGYDFERVTGVKVHFNYPKGKKLERAELLLTRYHKEQIIHAKKFSAYQAEALMLPRMPHSPNIIDAVGQGIEWLASVRLT